MKKRILISLGVLGLVLLAYSSLVETNWLEITHYEMKSALNRPLKIAHLSDLHIRSMGILEKKVLAALEHESPDIILITGDSVSSEGENEAFHEFLNKLSAPLGVWSAEGNWENWAKFRSKIKKLGGLPKSQMVNNRNVKIADDLYIVGLDDEATGRPNIEKAFRNKPADKFCISLFHSPALFDRLAGRCPLNLAGHTHGGQVRFPLLGAIYTPEGSGDYVAGWYEKNGSKLYVSRGIGTSVLNLRFLCRPELAIIELR